MESEAKEKKRLLNNVKEQRDGFSILTNPERVISLQSCNTVLLLKKYPAWNNVITD